ncbi:hypothetical protein JN00_0213 [Metamycoplasma subdolum]|uniref:Lipoprotein n=1 Tax=Metamycoplasma subdolum TaxID=92407 RepID=A0A3M0AH58_9BACT|nr:hypothetical protein [Metamycoplasma subdolum]RMA78572.1 hypothetical protein JN00_0213 [Metamycoplasma subdolum]WPB50289.1 hypothetical protein R9C05_01600 [Metamycoplasma subdolum]
MKSKKIFLGLGAAAVALLPLATISCTKEDMEYKKLQKRAKKLLGSNKLDKASKKNLEDLLAKDRENFKKASKEEKQAINKALDTMITALEKLVEAFKER